METVQNINILMTREKKKKIPTKEERIPFDWQTRKNQIYLKPNNTIYYLVYMEQDRGVQVDHAHPLDISPDM